MTKDQIIDLRNNLSDAFNEITKSE
jgi:hypothetical protein